MAPRSNDSRIRRPYHGISEWNRRHRPRFVRWRSAGAAPAFVTALVVVVMFGRTAYNRTMLVHLFGRRTVQVTIELMVPAVASQNGPAVISAANVSSTSRPGANKKSCAINLYGLPRNFADAVLPSLLHNVIRPNLAYGCDYFVHVHNKTTEVTHRGSRGGSIDPTQVYRLKDVIRREVRPASMTMPLVHFVFTTDDDFEQRYRPLLDQIFTTRSNVTGNLYYMPVAHESFTNDTVANVVRMWHAQQTVWHCMVRHEQIRGYRYERVAMLRNDVVYVTPMNVYGIPPRAQWPQTVVHVAKQLNVVTNVNKIAVVPHFARHPVNDRSFIGPRTAAEIWAAHRYALLEQHVALMEREHPGDGLHSERFVAYTIFPAIQQRGIVIVPDPSTCFLRTRADGSIRLADCHVRNAIDHNLHVVEHILGRTCVRDDSLIESNQVTLQCHGPPATETAVGSANLTWIMKGANDK